MSKTHIAGFVTTNVDNKSVNEGFLGSLSVMLAKLLHTDVEHSGLVHGCSALLYNKGITWSDCPCSALLYNKDISLERLSMTYFTSKHVSLELQPNVAMMKAASSAPMLHLRLFHNSDLVHADSKHQLAGHMAGWLAKQIRVPEDRVLVLFIDTRCCSMA